MSLNAHLVETPTHETFTLETLGLSDNNKRMVTRDEVKDDVLSMAPDNAPSAIIQSDMRTIGPHDTTLSSQEISQIPEWNNKIQLLLDTSDKLVDMKDVQKDIENNNGISQRQTDVIEATFENFYGSGNIRGMYTPFDSITNLPYARRFISEKIRSTTESLLTQFEEVRTDTMSAVAQEVIKTKDYCLTEFRDDINSAVGVITSIKDKLLAGPVILPFNDGEFINVLNEDLSKLDLTQIKSGVPLSDDFRRSFAMMLDVWNKDSLIRQTLTNLHKEYLSRNPDCVLPSTHEGLFTATIIAAFGEFSNDVLYDHFVTVSQKDADCLRQKIDEVAAELPKHDNPGELISSKASVIGSVVKNLVSINSHTRNLAQFAKASAVVLSNFVALR